MRSAILAVSLLAVAAGGFAFVHDTVDVDDAPRRLDSADLDGDGDVDLFVVADAGSQASLQVLLNDGGEFTAGWSAVQFCSSAAHPWDVDLSDTNGDGAPDVLYVLPSGSPFQRFDDGAGSFSTFGSVPAFAGRAEQEPGAAAFLLFAGWQHARGGEVGVCAARPSAPVRRLYRLRRAVPASFGKPATT